MPAIGEMKRGREIGKEDHPSRQIRSFRYVWHACILCGKERWVMLKQGNPKNLRCKSCANRGQENPNWKGRGNHDGRGYVRIFLRSNDFFYSMATKRGYITGHRLVMAKHLGRCLHPWEIVHHRNGIKDDNRIENLEIITYGIHHAITELKKKVAKLEEENRCLKLKLQRV